jgi:serine O-acetyltransferase
MVQKSFAAAEPQIKSYDPIWSQVRREAEEISAAEPALGGFIYATVLSHKRLEDAVCHRLARRLHHSALDTGLLHKTFNEVLTADPSLGDAFRADLMATVKRDPASGRLIEPLLYYKGFHALETYRIAHAVEGRAQGLRPLSAEPDFALPPGRHPSRCRDRQRHHVRPRHRRRHRETAVVGDNCSMLHGVTLGGTGGGRRHPKIGRGVMMGAGAKILGNIKVGDCASRGRKRRAQRRASAADRGRVPAREVGFAGCEEPALAMDQMFVGDDEASRS